LECAFCPKTHGLLEVKGFDLKMDHRPDVDEIIAAIDDPTKYREVVFCGYGEPTLRLKVLLEVAKHVKQRGGRVRLNTDGLANLVHKRNVLPELSPYVDALSISLNGQNAEIYDLHCQPNLRGSYGALIDFVRLAPEYIDDVTITAIDGLEGIDIPACEKIARDLGVAFRRRVLDQVG
jgi:TatD family-associated radical SAM protein